MMKQVECEKVDSEVLQCKPEDVIVLRYDMDKTSFDTASAIHSVMTDTFPNNKVITLPTTYSIATLTEEEVAEIIEQLTKYLETGQI